MYSKEAIKVFLEKQGQLFDEPVADTPEEAEEFLEDCMAVEVKGVRGVKKYLDELGADLSGMSDQEVLESAEVFHLSGGRFLVVEG